MSQMVAVVIAILGLGALIAGGTWLLRLDDGRLRKRRPGWTETAFIEGAVATGYDVRVAEAALRVLQNRMGGSDFPVLLNDSIYRVYKLSGEDVVDLVADVARDSGRAVPTDFDVLAIKDVGDVVTAVQGFPAIGVRS